MAVTQLQLYNLALRSIGERSISSLTEDRAPRRYLDDVWSFGAGAVHTCLEQGLWQFAMRAVQIDHDQSVSPSFGFTYAFSKPSDYVRLNQMSAGDRFSDPLTQYEEEGSYFYAYVDPIYVRYVSDGASYGGNLSLWPQSFSLWVGHWLGWSIAPLVKNDIDMDKLEKRTHALLVDARSKDAMEQSAKFPPLGTWNRARYGNYNYRDRGKRNQLIG